MVITQQNKIKRQTRFDITSDEVDSKRRLSRGFRKDRRIYMKLMVDIQEGRGYLFMEKVA